MKAAKPTVSERRELVGRLMAERAQTGETWRSVAARTGMAFPTLTGWASRLRREQPRSQSGTEPRSAGAGFVELVATDEQREELAFEVVLRGSRRVRVSAGFDAAELARLVRALEAC